MFFRKETVVVLPFVPVTTITSGICFSSDVSKLGSIFWAKRPGSALPLPLPVTFSTSLTVLAIINAVNLRKVRFLKNL